MTAVVAWGAVSAAGDGAAVLVGDAGAPARSRVARDPELSAAGLARPFCARAPVAEANGVDRATALLDRALAALFADLDGALPGWRERRVGLAAGTSSGGMRAFEARRDDGPWLEGTYLGPLLAASRPIALSPVSLVLGACASGTLAVGLGRAWLEAGACDLVLCGGFDAVSVFVASGFEAIRAVCKDTPPAPFRAGRSGLALGEGAAFVAMTRERDALARPRGFVTGFGASCDGVHLTAPDPEGAGLARAAGAALREAGAPPIALVSAHGTATVQNDAAEVAALARALPASRAKVHALKGAIGHTLGAAGALEAIAALSALEAGIAPASAGEGAAIAGVLDRAEALAAGATTAPAALKLSSAFGGANAALVLSRAPGPAAAPPREVFASRAVLVRGPAARLEVGALAERARYPASRLARADGLVRLAMAAVADLEAALRPDDARAAGRPLAGAGVVVGHGLATLETNTAHLARIREAGASRAEPRRFPYTTPNAAAGECAVAFGLTGPAFAVGGGPHGGLEALAVACDLVRARAADAVVVVAVDDAGEASRAVAADTEPGAVALLVSAAPPPACPSARVTSWQTGLGPRTHRAPLVAPRAMHAHRALEPLATGRPEALEIETSWGGFANAAFFWL